MKLLGGMAAAVGALAATLLAGQFRSVEGSKPIAQDANQAPTTGPYSLSGIVVNSATGEPIPRALVTLNMQTQRMVMTGPDGRFEFTSLPEGMAIAYARKPGFFTPQETGLSNAPYPSIRIGKDSSSISIPLFPTAIITGRVHTTAGEPIPRVPVRAIFLQVIDGDLQYQDRAMGSSDSTGQFKITNVMPGRYLISTRPTSVRQLSPMLRPFGEDFDLVYPGVYLGGARERSAATVIRVPPGQETEADFSLTPEKAYSISGTIGGAFNGQPMLQLLDRDGDPITAGAERRQHQFTFRNVSPGDYIVSATTMGDRSGGGNAFGATPVAVSAADVKDVAVELSPGIDIPLEMTAPAAVHLKAVAGRGLPFSSFYSQQVQRDGQTAYQIPQVAPGSYKVLVQGTPADSYVSSIRSGNTDLLENALIVAPGVTPAPIQITFQSGAAHLEVTIQGSDPVSQYVLVVAPDGPLPAQLYSASSRMNSGSSGSGTSFTVTGLAPGSYRLYAFTSIDGIAYRDRESMRAFDNQAVSVNLSANETKKIELPLISGNRS